MRLLKLLGLALVLTVPLGACGGDSNTEPPPPPYPDLSGVYDYDALVNGLPGAVFTGTITIIHASRETPTFSGTWTVSLVDQSTGEVLTTGTGDIVSASVNEDDEVAFNFSTADYHHTGTYSAGTITGTWILRGDTQNFTGTYTAIKR